jgi:hypothetical protein
MAAAVRFALPETRFFGRRRLPQNDGRSAQLQCHTSRLSKMRTVAAITQADFRRWLPVPPFRFVKHLAMLSLELVVGLETGVLE